MDKRSAGLLVASGVTFLATILLCGAARHRFKVNQHEREVEKFRLGQDSSEMLDLDVCPQADDRSDDAYAAA